MTAVLRVDLDAFGANLRVIRRRVSPAEHMLVVKDDAYGHGLAAVVGAAWREGVRWYGAFDVATGAAVRRILGPEARVFVWMLTGPEDIAVAADADLDLGVGDRALLEDVAHPGRGVRVHLKVDTGLHRNGIRPEEWDEAVAAAADHQARGAIRVEGVWSHLAEASDAEDDASAAQFLSARGAAARAGLTPRVSHLAASAAGFLRPEFRHDLVRIGAFAYGIRPAGGPAEDDLGIVPVSTLLGPVDRIDGSHARLAVGAADGLPSSLAGLISVRTPAGDRRVISIDHTHMRVEGWPGMRLGAEVAVLGAAAPQTFTDAAERIGTIGEELALRISPLVPREYSPA